MGAIHHVSVDLETYSDIDIAKAGLYRYAQSPAFEILLFGYSLDGQPRQVLDVKHDGSLPAGVQHMLFDPNVIKHAFNAAFEWYCLSMYFGLQCVPDFPPEAWLPQWRCTRLHVMYCGYPASLDAVGKAIGLPQDKQKLATGKALIQYFCKPCKPTKTNGQRTRNLPHHDQAKWELFKEYNGQDVVTEMAIDEMLVNFPVPDEVQEQWVTDQIINARGVAVDLQLAEGAREIDADVKAAYLADAQQLTQLDNPGSDKQFLEWMASQGVDTPNLQKATVETLLEGELPDSVRTGLEYRKELKKTSTAKYVTLEKAVCADGRVRGTLMFYGANRTGRWAGRLVQLQNLPRTYIKEELLPLARLLVQESSTDALQVVYGSAANTLSQLIRTAFIATPGGTLVDADFSAIEARVVAWLAGEDWVLDVFRTHGKIYEATASQLYGVPIEKIKKGLPDYGLRQYGKAATLALGYGGGPAALIRAGGLAEDTPENELIELRDKWRANNPHIKKLWYTVGAAADAALRYGKTSVLQGGKITVAREVDPENNLDFLTIEIPSGRKLYYPHPHWTTNKFGQTAIGYWGMNQQTHRWCEVETWGGKLVENITQAVARDCLAEAIEHLTAAGYKIVFHVHDEVIIDDPAKVVSLDEVVRIMSVPPVWAPDLPLNADGWVNPFFKKD